MSTSSSTRPPAAAGIRGSGAVAAVLARVPRRSRPRSIVNNGAAALSLAVTALAGRMASGMPARWPARWPAGPPVPSWFPAARLVEIGDGFRLPDLIASTGVRIAEVGTTNRTRLTDYASALDRDPGGVGALLKIHPSNFRVEGFTAEAGVEELAELGRARGLPLVVDIGSGLLHPDPALPAEPDATTALAAGADLVTCSGDKLLGGPQAGLVLGRTDLVARLRRHPLQRAFRVDKLTLAALEATLRGPEPPVTTYRRRTPDDLRILAEDLAARVAAATPELAPSVVPAAGRIGGGGAPGVELTGWAVALPVAFAAELRAGDPLVVARVEAGRCLLDPRCLEQAELGDVAAAVAAATERLGRPSRTDVPGTPATPGSAGTPRSPGTPA
jgi:L-seryl-tRNA(Ser) seleniumtransferase